MEQKVPAVSRSGARELDTDSNSTDSRDPWLPPEGETCAAPGLRLSLGTPARSLCPVSSVRPVQKRPKDAKVADVDGPSQRRCRARYESGYHLARLRLPQVPATPNEARATLESHNITAPWRRKEIDRQD